MSAIIVAQRPHLEWDVRIDNGALTGPDEQIMVGPDELEGSAAHEPDHPDSNPVGANVMPAAAKINRILMRYLNQRDGLFQCLVHSDLERIARRHGPHLTIVKIR